jgi:nicotinate-nucleotide adenylyltransferase
MALPARDGLRVMLWERITPRRVLHSLGTENVAVILAMRWGADPEEAGCAALLHDMTKDGGDQLQKLSACGIMRDEWEKTVPGAYHALTAAALAKEMGFGENLISAVRWHTTGRVEMSLLEKIIYLADKTEPFRPPYSGLEEIRRLMYTDLDGAVAMAIERIMQYNLNRGQELDKNSESALKWLLERMEIHEKR